MVSRILISIALLCSSVAMSQDEGNLIFNRVMTIDSVETHTVYCCGSGHIYSTSYEVPENKSWKIEFIYPHSGVILNDNIDIGNISSVIWLASGDKIKFEQDYTWNNQNYPGTQEIKYFISIIEFNTD